MLCASLMLATASAAPLAQTAQDSAIARGDTLRALTIAKNREEIEKSNRTFKFGVSVGWRHIGEDKSKGLFRNAVLQPGTDTVRLEKIDQGAVVLSGVVVAFPFVKLCDTSAVGWRRRFRPLGFIANIDLAEFSDGGVNSFNKSVEGGLGLAWRLSSDFSTAFTFERVFSRRPRSFVMDGQPLPVAVGEEPVLSRDDDKYFVDDNLTAVSFKFVYFFR